jgi:hypothetical protein
VGQHVADVDLAPVEMDGGDQPVFVPANVKHDEVPTLSAVGKVARKVSTLVKSCCCMILNHVKGNFTVRVLFPKLA